MGVNLGDSLKFAKSFTCQASEIAIEARLKSTKVYFAQILFASNFSHVKVPSIPYSQVLLHLCIGSNMISVMTKNIHTCTHTHYASIEEAV